MPERFEVILRLFVRGRYRVVARWENTREARETALWAARAFGGVAALVGTKEFEL